jgi:MFS family permease
VIFFQLYIAEISPAKYRGTLGSANQLGVTVGALLSFSLGPGLNWHWLAIAGAVPSTVMAILMLGFPETPRWLIKNGRISEACQVLVFLRKTSYGECEDECREIQSTLGKFYYFSSRSFHRLKMCCCVELQG